MEEKKLTVLHVTGLAVIAGVVVVFLWLFVTPATKAITEDFVNAAAANFLLPQGGDYVQ